jgi:hypothetical protein
LFIDVDEEQNARIETWLVLDNISGLSSTMALPFEVGRSLLVQFPHLFSNYCGWGNSIC